MASCVSSDGAKWDFESDPDFNNYWYWTRTGKDGAVTKSHDHFDTLNRCVDDAVPHGMDCTPL